MEERTAIQYAKGVGEKRALLFQKMGLRTVGDVLRHFPRDYEDRTRVVPVAALQAGIPACFEATVCEPVSQHTIRKGLDIGRTWVTDEDGTALELVFFNAPYVKDALRSGEAYSFYGKPAYGPHRLVVQNPVFEKLSAQGRVTGRILPVYPLTAGLTQGLMRNVAAQALEGCRDGHADLLGGELAAAYGLCGIRQALEDIHFPRDMDAMRQARRRLVFEELLVLQLGLGQVRLRRRGLPSRKLETPELGAFFKELPYAPTGAQKRAIQDIADDLRGGYGMNRLVQGDVGSGKTLIAAAAAYLVCAAGRQTAMMAPTALLCEQHFAALLPLMTRLGVPIGLLTGSMKPKQRRDILAQLEDGRVRFVIGTHALFSEGVRFQDLALCVTDEQHRFGVDQRQLLAQKGEQAHSLVMSATPIPRTLAHILYGDLDLSVVDELPPGRQKVDTYVVDEGYRARIEAFIRKLVAEGRQAFIVCPLIEDENETGLQSVEEYAQKLRDEVFPELRVGVVHGKLKAAAQETVMRAFAAGNLDILVSTTVIEVGVNVPNAALMVVENAERFGLSQLHQLRGRVGRGAHKSYCVLFAQGQDGTAAPRLAVLRSTNDGFLIAEQDLQLRGPGDFFGSRQHGLPAFELADLSEDTELLTSSRTAAQDLLNTDPSLRERPALQAAVRRLVERLG